MNDFLTFKKMITPIVIQILFWIGVLATFVSAIVSIATGTAQGVVGGIIWLFLGPILVRVYCELLIVFFRIRDLLEEIKSNTAPKGA